MKMAPNGALILPIPLLFPAGGGGRTRTYEGVSQRIYSPPPLPLGTLPRSRTSHPMDARSGRVMGSASGGVNHAEASGRRDRGARDRLDIGLAAQDCRVGNPPCATAGRVH